MEKSVSAQKSLVGRALVVTLKERFPGDLSTSSISQSLFVPVNVVLKRYTAACRAFSKCLPHSKELCLFIHALVKLMLTISCNCSCELTTAAVEYYL